MWRGLAVVVMGAGMFLLAVLPSLFRRLRVEHLGHTAAVLSAKEQVPALARADRALASGGPQAFDHGGDFQSSRRPPGPWKRSSPPTGRRMRC